MMKINLNIIDFNILQPNKLKILSEKIEKNPYKLENINYSIEKLIVKIRKKRKLTYREHLVAIQAIDQIVENNVINEYKKILSDYLKLLNNRKSKILLNTVMKTLFPNYYNRYYFEIINMVINSSSNEGRYTGYKERFDDGWSKAIDKMNRELENSTFKRVYNNVFPNISISNNNKFVCEWIYRYAITNKFNEDVCLLIIEYFDELNDYISIAILDEYLLSLYSQINKFEFLENYHHKLLRKMYTRFKEPDNTAIWNNFNSKAIEVYNRWLLLNKLLNYFENLSIKREERLVFWKNYFRYFTNIEFYIEYDSALIIETENHTFVEFGGANGGATFYYDKSVLNIEIIKNEREKWHRTLMISKVLKNGDIANNRMTHRGYWQNKYHNYMKRIGYVRR